MASINLIKASDGTGPAAVATVQSTRSPGATTLTVDTVENIPATFMGTMGTPHNFTDPVTSETITVISEATAVDFTGHVSTTHLEIDDIAPGFTDAGSSAGDIVIIKPTTEWADNIADVLAVSHADDGTINATAIYDSNANEAVKFGVTASAVNEVTVTNAATGSGPTLSATGGDTNIDLKLTPKGTGRVILNAAGAPQSATVTTSQATTSATYTDLTTTGPAVTVTIGNSGAALVIIEAQVTNNTAGAFAIISWAASGANTVASADAQAFMHCNSNLTNAGNAAAQGSTTYLLTGLTAGSTTFTAKYRAAAGGTATFSNRVIAAIPL